MKAFRGSRAMVPVTCNLGTNWWYVVNFTLQLLYPLERSSVIFRKGEVGSQSWSGHFGKEKNFLPLFGFKLLIVQPIV